MPNDETLRFRAKLADLFPRGHPDTPWLMRLMIIRDDLEFELRSIWIRPEEGTEAAWRCSYFLRRMSISIIEARGILSFEVGKAANRSDDDTMKGLAPHLKDVIKVVEEAAATFESLRNAVGAHLRPQYADPTVDCVVSRVLENCPNLEGEVELSLSDVRRSSFRDLTPAALLFAWPDVDSDEMHAERHKNLLGAISASVPRVLTAIDSLLARHWWNLGVLQPPEGYDFAVLDKKSGQFRPVSIVRK